MISRSTARSSSARRSSSRAPTSAAARRASTPPGRSAGRGFRAIIAPSFADIFRSNCGKNGLLTVELPEADVRELMEAAPAVATVDLERRVVTLPSGREVEFEVDEDVRYRLLGGHDDIGLTLQRVDAIDEHERERERPGPSTLAL